MIWLEIYLGIGILCYIFGIIQVVSPNYVPSILSFILNFFKFTLLWPIGVCLLIIDIINDRD